MKKMGIVLLIVLLLAGCGSPVDYETMSDVYLEPEQPQAAGMLVVLPPDAAVMTAESQDSGSIWLCDGYSVMTQILNGGDLDATLRSVTGYGREQLPVIELEEDGLKRWECVWTCAGEGGDQVGRAVILTDGTYHYVLSLLTDAALAGELADTWQQITGSFSLDIVP